MKIAIQIAGLIGKARQLAVSEFEQGKAYSQVINHLNQAGNAIKGRVHALKEAAIKSKGKSETPDDPLVPPAAGSSS